MAEFRDWRAPYKLARERLLEARRNRVPVRPFTRDDLTDDFLQQVEDANRRSERAAEFNPSEKTDGELRTPIADSMERGQMQGTSQGRDGKSVVYGAQPGTKAFYKEKGVQAPEPYIERIDDFGEGGGGQRGGIKSTILSGKTGEPLKDQRSARRRMVQGAVTRHAKRVADAIPATEVDLP